MCLLHSLKVLVCQSVLGSLEASIMPSNTINSVFYCPHIPQLIWDVHDTISPWIFAAVASIISPDAVLLNALVIIAVMKRRELEKLSNLAKIN